ncbi:MAG TPA: hypothetical protein PLZ62_00210 [bacterium]|nr:hypothetical protein [bacterium]
MILNFIFYFPVAMYFGACWLYIWREKYWHRQLLLWNVLINVCFLVLLGINLWGMWRMVGVW